MKRSLPARDQPQRHRKQQATEADYAQSRTVYIGNLPCDISPEDVFNSVKGGAVESLRLTAEKGCAFMDFVECQAAANFCYKCNAEPIFVRGAEAKVGIAKPNYMTKNMRMAVYAGATRNIYFGGIDEHMSDEFFLLHMEKFGQIDTIRVLKEKKIAFVHFVNISSAIQAIVSLSSSVEWMGKKVNFGRDRCSDERTDISNNRTLYIGGLAPGVTIEDLCNAIRGGMVYNIKIVAEKNCSFVTFVDPNAAAAFCSFANYQGVVVKGSRIKVAWGRSSAMPASAACALYRGATRNIYIGNIDAEITVERLTEDFSEHGLIEQINILRQKSIAFVNFCNVLNAAKALDAISVNPFYSKFKLSFGKDRCASVSPTELLAPLMNSYYNQAAQYYSQIQQPVNCLPDNLHNFEGQHNLYEFYQTQDQQPLDEFSHYSEPPHTPEYTTHTQFDYEAFNQNIGLSTATPKKTEIEKEEGETD